MTYRQIADMIASIGVPASYYQFADDTGQEPPFICYYFDSSSGFAADDQIYAEDAGLIIELYTDNKNFALEQTVKNVLNAAGLPWSRTEAWIDTERMLQVTFTTSVLIEEEE